MILDEDVQDVDENNDGVTASSDNDASTNDGSDSDTASSLSSTPLMALKQAKMRIQKTKPCPKARKSKGATSKISTETKKSRETLADLAAPVKRKPREMRSTMADQTEKSAILKWKAVLEKDDLSSTHDRAKGRNKKEADDSKIHTSGSEEDDDDEEEEVACCLCHCGVDCSDRALFFPRDRKLELEEDEDYYFGSDDPYLDGEKLYDQNNALVYCDTCNRLYHQKCHFVPLLVVPRGEFHCLICSIQQQQKVALQGKKEPSKKRERKGSTKASGHLSSVSEKFYRRKTTDLLFKSPPTKSSKGLDIKSIEKEWEIESGPAKARLWDIQFKQLRTFLKSQTSNIRMANTTLATMTSTKRNRQHFLESSTKTGTKSSQELAQTLCKLTGAKFKIREALLSLESLRVNNESIDFSSLYTWCQENPNHADHVFPFGSTFCMDERRIVPRTREREKELEESDRENSRVLRKPGQKTGDIIPQEILVRDSTSEIRAESSKESAQSNRGKKSGRKSEEESKTKNDDDSGITLDNLQCAVCMIGDATDENDVILCDGKDCHRAYHMKCVYPAVKIEDIENEDEDWFCPICSYSSKLIGEIHDLCVADENEEDSVGSWDDVHDVFPGSQWEYETAKKILKGKRNEDTQRLLAMYLGEDVNKNKVQMPVGSDSEDENDYSLFDEDSFAERRKQEREDENNDRSDDDDSVCSSQATLQEMDDIDYKVGKAELAALSEEEGSDSDSDDESENKIRRSRRLVRKEEVEESNLLDVGADFDEANIIVGKRKRKRVNYRKLNDMMFGDLSDHQQGMIDGGDDFDATSTKQMKTESDNESGSKNSNDQSDDGSDNDS